MNINKPQYARLLFIDKKIRSGNFPNAAVIAEEYEVAQRTILRDIEYMRDMLGAPIEYDNSRRGYFYLEKTFFLPALDMSESDFFAICITEQALKQYENTPLYEKLSAIFNRLREYLPESIRVNTTWIDTEYTFMHESFTRIDPDVWENVSSALRQKKQIDILHRKAGAQEDVRRLVDPYHIVNYRGEWYLVGFCHKRQSVVRFAMSRIHGSKIQGTGYDIPADFNFRSFMGSSFGIMTEDSEHMVKIRFSRELAPYVTERQWNPGQEIRQGAKGSVTLIFRTNSLFEVKRWVLSWGGGAEVLAPALLRNMITEDVKKLAGTYLQTSHTKFRTD